MKESVSIIIPTYNSSQWIERCLNSVVSAIDNTCEIIVVDDGSSDMTMAIVEDYAGNHRNSKIRVVGIEHSGPGAARRAGVRVAKGQWITFVDSDDVILSDSLSRMRMLVDDETDIICANVTIKSPTNVERVFLGEQSELTGRAFAIKVLNSEILGILPAKLFRRSLFDGINWDDDSIITNHEDAMLLLMLATVARGKVKVVPSIHAYVYYRRGGSQSSMLKMSLEGLERVWNNVKGLGLPNDALTRWGLSLLYQTFISRGIVFENSYGPAVELRRMSRRVNLDKVYRRTAWMLYSKRLRRYIMRRHVRDGLLTMAVPHLAFILYCRNDIHGVNRTVKSILDTGLRNIEIIIVNDASDQNTSVSLNALQVKYRRVRVLKNTTSLGGAISRSKAVKASQSYAVMFVRPGDTVCRDGVYEALVKIDNGADMALMGTGIRWSMMGMSGMREACVTSHDDDMSEWSLKAILGRFSTVPPLDGVMFKREFITDEDCVDDNDVAPMSGELLMRLSLNMRASNVNSVDTLGYVNAVEPCHCRDKKTRHRRIFKMADEIIDMLVESGMDDYLPELANGLEDFIVNDMACLMANPFVRRARVMAEINSMIEDDEYRGLLSRIGADTPDADTMYRQSCQRLKSNIWMYTTRRLRC